ncbi:MAG: hypothetical protein RLY97_557 [Pseudomonadota bacterium]
MRQAGEPSVDEILESIKKVIARDNREGFDRARKMRETDGMPEDSSDKPPMVLGKSAANETRDDILDLAMSAQFLDDDSENQPIHPADSDNSPLITAESRAAMRESLAALAMMAQAPAAPQIVRSGETSLEGLVRDMLRPALATWLDTNLPPMVEKLVASEIARIVGKKS